MNLPTRARTSLSSVPGPAEPPALHLRAMDNLRFIRQTMEDAVYFTAVSGVGEIAVGLTALAEAWLAARQATAQGWLAVWLAEALIAAVVTGGAVVWKARQARLSLVSRPGRRFALGLVPPLVAGALLSVALFAAGERALLPGMWLLLYGTAVSPAAPSRCASCRSWGWDSWRWGGPRCSLRPAGAMPSWRRGSAA